MEGLPAERQDSQATDSQPSSSSRGPYAMADPLNFAQAFRPFADCGQPD